MKAIMRIACPHHRLPAVAMAGAALLVASLASGEEKAVPTRPFVAIPEDVAPFFERLHFGHPGRLAFREGEVKDVAAWRENGRDRLRELLGLQRMETELAGHEPVVTLSDQIEDHGDFTRRKGRIETEPGMTIPF